MKKKLKAARPSRDADTLRAEYDFSKGVRGKYAKRYWHNNNLVVLSREVAKYFSDSEAVNEALRTLLRLSGRKVASFHTAENNRLDLTPAEGSRKSVLTLGPHRIYSHP